MSEYEIPLDYDEETPEGKSTRKNKSKGFVGHERQRQTDKMIQERLAKRERKDTGKTGFDM